MTGRRKGGGPLASRGSDSCFGFRKLANKKKHSLGIRVLRYLVIRKKELERHTSSSWPDFYWWCRWASSPPHIAHALWDLWRFLWDASGPLRHRFQHPAHIVVQSLAVKREGGPLLLPQLSRLSPWPRLTKRRPYLKATKFDPLFHLLELAFSISFLAVENPIREIEKKIYFC